ncbi:MAG TPA: PilN domain-containing protein [Gemmatimonadales bacterium]|nr:PilN domain-containing protein [Gemmatimonadales bacterium]
MMIEINLRPGQKRKRAGASLKTRLETRARELAGQVKDPLLLVAVAAWVVVVAFIGWTYVATARQLHALEPRFEQAKDEHRRFATLMRQKRKAEQVRDSLLAQINTIRGVDGDRYVWPHILDEVAKALPPYTWLVDLSVLKTSAPADSADTAAAPVQFQLSGRTVDIQAYTRFLRQLEASPWLADVTPVTAQTVVEQERAVTAFTIRASFSPADSAYIRTVPVSQSVR